MADPIQRASNTVAQTVIDIGGIVNGVADRVKGIVNDALKEVFDPLGAALQAQLQVFGDLVTGLLQNLATPEELIGSAYGEWEKLSAAEDGPSQAIAHWLAETAPEAFSHAYTDSFLKPMNEFLNGGPPNVPVALDPEDIRKSIAAMPFSMRGFMGFWATLVSTLGYLQALHAGGVEVYKQASYIDVLPTPLSPAELGNAVVQNQVPQDWAAEHAKRSGLSPELFDILVKTFGLPPGLSEMLNLLNRGVIDEDTVRQSIAESHTKTKYTDALMQLRYAVPTIAEITHWLTRDAFIDEFVQRYGMDAEYNLSSDKSDPLFKANAVSPDYVKYIWRSHWTLPSPGAGAEMYFRTDDAGTGEDVPLPGGGSTKRIISRDDLQRLYRAAGFEPWWRDPMLKIAFQPLSRIDSRRLYLAGIIDDAAFYRSALNIGYDEATATLFLTWMQAQKTNAQRAQAEKHTRPILRAALDQYKRGLIGAAELEAQAAELDQDPDEVKVMEQMTDLERAQERATKIRDGLHKLYVDGFIAEDEAASRLQAEGFTQAEWMRLRDDWRVDVEFRQHSEDAKATRALTRTQIIAAYKDQILTHDDAVTDLQQMGYHDDEITLWMELADFEEAQRIASVAREAVHEDYVDQIIDVVTARSQLHDMRLKPEQVDALLRRWTSERRRRTPNLSAGQIESAFKNKTIDEPKTRDLLAQLRYTSDEVDVLVGNWSTEVGVSEERLKLEQERFAYQQQRDASRTSTQQSQFDARAAAQQARLTQQESFAQAQQARQQEAAVAHAATAFERQQQAQAKTLAAQSERQQKTLDAAVQRQDAAFAERDKQAALALQARQAAQAATDARQQKTLQAAADRQQAAFEHADAIAQQRQQERLDAEQRAQGYKLAAEQRQQQYQQAKEQRVGALKVQAELRANRRELEKELRQQSYTQAKEGRATATRIQSEQRVSERKAALSQAASQAESTIANLRLQQAQSAQQSADDIYNQVVQQAQNQIGQLPSGS